MALADLLSDYGLSKEDINLDIVEATLSSSLNLNFVDPATNTIYYKSLANFATYLKTNELTYSNSTQANVRAAINTDTGVTSGVLMNTEAAFWMFDEFRKTANTFTALQTMTDIKLSNQLNKNFLKTDSSGKIVKASLTNGKSIKGNLSNEPEEFDLASASAFDATIGTGYDYLTLTAAITALGANKRFRIIGTVNESANITSNCTIYLDYGSNLNMGNYNFQYITYLCIEGFGTITFNYSTAKYLFLVCNCQINGKGYYLSKTLTITNTSTLVGGGAAIADRGVFNNIKCNLPNVRNCGFGGVAGEPSFSGELKNIWFVGGGSSCGENLIYANSPAVSSHTNLYFTGTFANTTILADIFGKYKNIHWNSASDVTFYIYGTDGLSDVNYKVTIIQLYATIKLFIQNCVFKTIATNYTYNLLGCYIRNAVTTYASLSVFSDIYFYSTVQIGNSSTGVGGNNVFDDKCYFNDNVTIYSDSNNISGTFAPGKTITLAAGAEYNIIKVHTDTDVIDNSGNMTNSIEYLP